VLVPRVWRFVDRLPEDAQGKTSVAALQALFRSPVGR
jgi:acyl-coenzyme A synthetase/AMP-(fatty) acid ligase